MIRFEQVSKRYADGTVAVEDLSFQVAEGELVTLVGPSGCGKTTTMKMVNRLIEPTSGQVLLNGEDIAAADPVELRRRIGYVIQQVGLLPHKTVLENTETVPRLLGQRRARSRARAAELLELVGLDPATHGRRYPDQLSGGQRQRVGVARALAADPPVLLLDEPFGAVDPLVREHLQGEFRKLQETVRKTVLFVTHDIEEAVRMGDRMAVYGAGRLEQLDAPSKVLGAPRTDYVADFVGADRGLKRLSVTPIERSDLEQPPIVRLDDRMAEATRRMRAEDTRWAVVLDATGKLHGWVSSDAQPPAADVPGPVVSTSKSGAGPGGSEGSVRAHARRMEAWLPLGHSLKQAFSTMLQYDAGWIAVLDGDRFEGVLTPSGLHEALRRSIGTEQPSVGAELGALPLGKSVADDTETAEGRRAPGSE